MTDPGRGSREPAPDASAESVRSSVATDGRPPADGAASGPGEDAGSEAGNPEESGGEDGRTAGADGGAYGGAVGAFPYAFRASDSWLFRTYAAAGGLLAAAVVVVFALALVSLLGRTQGATGGTFTFSRAFFLVLLVLVLGPVVAPVLLVARRHRRTGSTAAYDRGLAAAGYAFALALYLGLVVSAPADLTDPAGGPLGPVVGLLYALPRAAGVVPPLVAAALVYAVHRALR